MNIIRKILKANLANLVPTDDIIVSLTETGELYFNTKTGANVKVSDIVQIDSDINLSQISPIVGKFYFIKNKNTCDLKLYTVDGFVSISDGVDAKLLEVFTQIGDLNLCIIDVNENLTNSISTLSDSVNLDISTINDTISNLEIAINSINLKSETNTTSIKNILDSITTINASIIAINATMSEQIISINEQLQIKKYTSVVDIQNLKDFAFVNETYIPAYLFKESERLYIDEILIRTKNLPTENIIIEIRHAPELESGRLDVETKIDEITLSTTSFINSKKRVQNFIETEGLRNGYLRVYVKDSGANHTDVSVIMKIFVRNPVVNI